MMEYLGKLRNQPHIQGAYRKGCIMRTPAAIARLAEILSPLEVPLICLERSSTASSPPLALFVSCTFSPPVSVSLSLLSTPPLSRLRHLNDSAQGAKFSPEHKQQQQQEDEEQEAMGETLPGGDGQADGLGPGEAIVGLQVAANEDSAAPGPFLGADKAGWQAQAERWQRSLALRTSQVAAAAGQIIAEGIAALPIKENAPSRPGACAWPAEAGLGSAQGSPEVPIPYASSPRVPSPPHPPNRRLSSLPPPFSCAQPTSSPPAPPPLIFCPPLLVKGVSALSSILRGQAAFSEGLPLPAARLHLQDRAPCPTHWRRHRRAELPGAPARRPQGVISPQRRPRHLWGD